MQKHLANPSPARPVAGLRPRGNLGWQQGYKGSEALCTCEIIKRQTK